MKTLIPALLAGLLLAGCSSAAPVAPVTVSAPSSTPSPSKTGPVSYGSVTELRDAAVAAGYDCPSWEQENNVTLAAESGACSDADVFMTFTGEDDRDELVANLKAMATETIGVTLLVGPNWVINTEDGLESLQEALGGTIVRK